MEREPNTIYVLSLSYGKDSLACIEACRQLGYPIDRIIHAEVWATDDIPADLPPMVEFKKKADKIIKERYGIEVEHVCAMTTPDKKYGGGGTSKQTYERMFYDKCVQGLHVGRLHGFPHTVGGWCRRLKLNGGSFDLRRYVLQTAEAQIEKGTIDNRGGGQTSQQRASRCEKARGASNSKPSIYGFPIINGQWCNSNLKMQQLRFRNEKSTVVSKQSQRSGSRPNKTHFYRAPRHKARKQML